MMKHKKRVPSSEGLSEREQRSVGARDRVQARVWTGECASSPLIRRPYSTIFKSRPYSTAECVTSVSQFKQKCLPLQHQFPILQCFTRTYTLSTARCSRNTFRGSSRKRQVNARRSWFLLFQRVRHGGSVPPCTDCPLSTMPRSSIRDDKDDLKVYDNQDENTKTNLETLKTLNLSKSRRLPKAGIVLVRTRGRGDGRRTKERKGRTTRTNLKSLTKIPLKGSYNWSN